MKKLMIAAAAAALVGGAYAGEDLHTYNLTSNDVPMLVTQVVQFKMKTTTKKFINLIAEKKLFGKTIKDSLMEFDHSGFETDLAIDGVYYYDGDGSGKWEGFVWNKQGIATIKGEGKALTFDVFENTDNTKAIAALDWETKNARARVYGTLKYTKDPVTKIKTVVPVLSGLKDTLGQYTYTIKTFKDKGTPDKSSYKSAQAQVNAFKNKLWEKALKAQPKVK